MSRVIANLVLILTLLLQGMGAAGAAAISVHQGQEHCAGHDMQKEECPCCPKGMTMGTGCTVQCSVAQAPVEFRLQLIPESHGPSGSFVARILRDPTYVPLVPPPIA